MKEKKCKPIKPKNQKGYASCSEPQRGNRSLCDFICPSELNWMNSMWAVSDWLLYTKLIIYGKR